MHKVKPDKIPKVTLKDVLFEDETDVLVKIATSEDAKEKELYQYAYNLVKKYINICKNRKRF
jgi:hypothetical protein